MERLEEADGRGDVDVCWVMIFPEIEDDSIEGTRTGCEVSSMLTILVSNIFIGI